MTYPTNYLEVNAVVDDMLARVRGVLGNDLVGMYLCGSVALDDFMPNRSDVDVVIVTTDELSDRTFAALKTMHTQFVGNGLPLVNVLEASYVPLNDLREYDATKAVYPRIDCGETLRVEHSSWWVIDRYVLREHGMTVAGPPPKTLVASVSKGELKQAVITILHQHWKPKLQKQDTLHVPGYQVYAVLTMCRILYTLQHGTVVSKSVATEWAQHWIGKSRTSLIAEAFAWRNGQPFNNLNETLDLIEYTLEH